MNHILGFAQLLASKKGLTDKQEASVRQILESGRRFLTLIDHILGFSKSDPSELSFEALGAPRADETKSLRSLSWSWPEPDARSRVGV
jgi:signal transduction histidine kinase